MMKTNFRRESDEFNFDRPGMLPWSNLHHKGRIRALWDETRYGEHYKKPKIEAKHKKIQVIRHNRVDRSRIDGDVSGNRKLLYLQLTGR